MYLSEVMTAVPTAISATETTICFWDTGTLICSRDLRAIVHQPGGVQFFCFHRPRQGLAWPLGMGSNLNRFLIPVVHSEA